MKCFIILTPGDRPDWPPPVLAADPDPEPRSVLHCVVLPGRPDFSLRLVHQLLLRQMLLNIFGHNFSLCIIGKSKPGVVSQL